MEDVLARWHELVITNASNIGPNVETLNSELEKYGVIKKFNHDDTKGYVTLYCRGEGGDSATFYVENVDAFLPSAGDLVTVTESDEYDTHKMNNKLAEQIERLSL